MKNSINEMIDDVLSERESGGKSVQVLKRGEATVAGRAGAFVEFIATSPRNPSEQGFCKTYVFIHGPLGYGFHYAATSQEGYDKYLAAADGMVDSFKPIPDELTKELF